MMTDRRVWAALVSFAVISSGLAEASAQTITKPGTYWVAAKSLGKRTCPSPICGLVGELEFQDQTAVLELKDGWARISEFIDAACSNEISQSVIRGYNRCVLQNGISNGRYAAWVPADKLSPVRPAGRATVKKTATRTVAARPAKPRVYGTTYKRKPRKHIPVDRCTVLQCE
ncbi:MAG: hypothetical protein ACR2O4_11075 [Hyphomicrobiaceae bacterium]